MHGTWLMIANPKSKTPKVIFGHIYLFTVYMCHAYTWDVLRGWFANTKFKNYPKCNVLVLSNEMTMKSKQFKLYENKWIKEANYF